MKGSVDVGSGNSNDVQTHYREAVPNHRLFSPPCLATSVFMVLFRLGMRCSWQRVLFVQTLLFWKYVLRIKVLNQNIIPTDPHLQSLGSQYIGTCDTTTLS